MGKHCAETTEEKQALLFESEAGFENFNSPLYPLYKPAVTKGVANHVGKWPSHLFAAFLAASLVFAAFVLLATATALFCAPAPGYKCRWKDFAITEFPNIYFIKDTNRTWTTREMCYIESTARDYPETDILLINLLTESSTENNFLRIQVEKIEVTKHRGLIEMLWEKRNNSMGNIENSSRKMMKEMGMREKLATIYPNVRNVDVKIDDFFTGSMLTTVYHKLDSKALRLAAKAFLLWNTPGVALEPYDSPYIRTLRDYLCKGECKTLRETFVNSEGSVQASGVPCQAFLGSLIHELATGGTSDDREIIERAQNSFCQSRTKCTGLKILKEVSSLDQTTSCPLMYPPTTETSSTEAVKLNFETEFTKKLSENVRYFRRIFMQKT